MKKTNPIPPLLFAVFQITFTLTANAAADYNKTILPLMKEYCLGCHSTEKHKGDLDLERFKSIDEIRKHPKVWQS